MLLNLTGNTAIPCAIHCQTEQVTRRSRRITFSRKSFGNFGETWKGRKKRTMIKFLFTWYATRKQQIQSLKMILNYKRLLITWLLFQFLLVTAKRLHLKSKLKQKMKVASKHKELDGVGLESPFNYLEVTTECGKYEFNLSTNVNSPNDLKNHKVKLPWRL
ncbi:long isoform,Ulvan lyase [Trichinella spiralis]|uniref:Long isoform,Ulvan lyase n=1 Tax=Trichinella spiralis TaxID=6334 RepID=A0ABR3K7J0_TRISP